MHRRHLCHASFRVKCPEHVTGTGSVTKAVGSRIVSITTPSLSCQDDEVSLCEFDTLYARHVRLQPPLLSIPTSQVHSLTTGASTPHFELPKAPANQASIRHYLIVTLKGLNLHVFPRSQNGNPPCAKKEASTLPAERQFIHGMHATQAYESDKNVCPMQ